MASRIEHVRIDGDSLIMVFETLGERIRKLEARIMTALAEAQSANTVALQAESELKTTRDLLRQAQEDLARIKHDRDLLKATQEMPSVRKARGRRRGR